MRLAGLMLFAVLTAGAAAGGGYLFHRFVNQVTVDARPAATRTVAAVTSSPSAAARRPDFTLPDTDGRARRIDEWDGKLLIVNFWATWCPPCVHEIPVFNLLQRRYADEGVQFLGIAIDDLANVKTFMDEVGLDYPTLHGQLEAMELGRAFGNVIGGLPYTVIVGRDGNIVHRQSGPLDEETAVRLIAASL